MPNFDDTRMRLRNTGDNLTHLVRATLGISEPMRLPRLKPWTSEAESKIALAAYARDTARLVSKELSIARSAPNQLEIIAERGGEDASISAYFFGQYLTYACAGGFGRAGSQSSVTPRWPVLLTAEPRFDKELAGALGIAKGGEAPADFALSRGLQHRKDLNAASAIEILRELPLDGLKTISREEYAEKLAAAAVKLSPAFQILDFAQLEGELERRSLLELSYPRVEIVLTETPENIAFLARRISIDLNVRIRRR